jgi:eukaryotic-like serine/threonine-protein kinase
MSSLRAALADRFRFERELGRGGMATVYLVHDLRQDRPVALKVIRPELASALGPDRFLREIKLTATLRHPHILPLFDSGEAEGQLWYTMPYIEGQTLRQRLNLQKRLAPEEALRIIDDVLAALTHAHAHGITHRDIKPENILLEGGEAVLADFGIAHAVTAAGTERLTEIGLALGTPAYMSPEQAAGGEIDHRSDVYSVGCVLYECLSGRPPFEGASPQAIVAKQLTESPLPIVPTETVPGSVADAVHKALAKNPAERFQTAPEFSAALGKNQETRVRPRRRKQAALAALAVLGVLGLAFYAGRRVPAASPPAGAVASGFNRQLRQLTFGEGVEEWPAWSPDGKRIAYVAEVDGIRQLFLGGVSSGEERRLSRERKDDIQPAWSADGQRLAFVRARTSGGKLEPNDINGWYQDGGDIWTVELVSGQEMRLVENGFNPAYAPRGERLAFDAAWAGARRIWVADAFGRNPRQVTVDSSEAVVHTAPRWSPDGSMLAFRRVEGIKSEIMAVDVASQTLTRVTNDNAVNMDPVWAPDGQSIYYTSSRGGGLNLWRIGVRRGEPTGAPEQLTTGAGDDVQPSPAPDGSKVAFAVRGINSDLWRLPVDPRTGQPTSQPEALVRTTRVESRSALSPDGSTVAFNSDRLGEMNIWLRTVADSAERRLTEGSGGDYQPNWAPDGKTIAFFSARAGNADIWSVQVGDGRLTRLTDSPATDTNPFYSPDGKRIAFLSDRSGRSELWVMNADGTSPRAVASVVAGGHFLRWTRDGKGIVFRAESGPQAQIYRASVEDGSLTRLPDIASGAHMSFSPDQSRILDVRGHKTLWVYPVDGSTPHQVFASDDPDVRIDYPTWAPDGRWILFDRAAPRGGDLWMIEGRAILRSAQDDS